MISFKVTEDESDTISRIVDRIMLLSRQHNLDYDRLTAYMDITATHANGCPLDLDGLLVVDDFTFSHDVFGIYRHIDRDTGKLLNCFVPRTRQYPFHSGGVR